MAFMAQPIASGPLLDEFGVFRVAQRFFLNVTAAGNTPLVAAQGPGVRVRVLAMNVNSSSALTVKFQSDTTDISSEKSVSKTEGWIAPQAEAGWFQTAPNEALNVNLSEAGAVGVDIIWVQAG